jgi:diguanylate cyclase (GGDEF)-like protein
VRDLEVVRRLPGAGETFHSVNASPLRDAFGTIFGAVSVGRDVTAARAAQRALARNEAVLQAVVKHLPNGAVLLFDHDLRYLMADGEQLLASIGFVREAMIGRTLYEIASPQGLPIAEPAYRGALTGQTQTLEILRGERTYALTIVPVRDRSGAVTAGLALVYDVTAHKRNEALARKEANEIRSLTVKDELTQLYNRRGFLQLASERLSHAARMARPALLFFVDLNGMKQINDQLGHEQGDCALIETADVLRATCRSSDVIARLGGDEFVALLVDGDEAVLASFSERVQREIDAHNAQPNRAYRLSASIGGAAYDPQQPERIEALLARADALMYEQKRRRLAAGKSIHPGRV